MLAGNLPRKVSHQTSPSLSRRRKKSIFHYPSSQQTGAVSKKRATSNETNDAAEKTRRRSTYFVCSGVTSTYEQRTYTPDASHYGTGLDHDEYREHYRRTLLRMHAEDELAKCGDDGIDKMDGVRYVINPINGNYGMRTIQKPSTPTAVVEPNKVFLFIKFMATEHEELLQLLIFLPLILASLYIVFVEKKPLVT